MTLGNWEETYTSGNSGVLGLRMNQIYRHIKEGNPFVAFGLFVVLAVLGSYSELLLKSSLYGNNVALGPHTVSMFIPVPLSLMLFSYFFIARRITMVTSLTTVVLFIILTLPFMDVWFSTITHLGDDPARYSLYAWNMVNNGTLWGGDELWYGPKYGSFLVDQFGIRYYLALTIKLLGGEFRITQLLGMLIYLLVFIATMSLIQSKLSRGMSNMALVFGLLSAPYAVKNILFGLSEWLTVCCFALAFVSFIHDKRLLAAFLLGLTVVLRSNLVVFSPLCLIFLFPRSNWKIYPAFLIAFLLPFVHNLYYGQTFQLLPSNYGGILILEEALLLAPAQAFLHKLIHLVGVCLSIKFSSNLFGLLFVPFGSGLLILCLLSEIHRQKQLGLLILIIGSLVGPTIFFGSAYFPRFEFVNWMLGLIAVCWFKVSHEFPYRPSLFSSNVMIKR
jgi:hypothetical protein